MFYEPDKRNHGLRYNPFKALVVPRPIGWISSVDTDGIPNLAPYSMFNAVADDPPCVMSHPARRSAGLQRIPNIARKQRVNLLSISRRTIPVNP